MKNIGENNKLLNFNSKDTLDDPCWNRGLSNFRKYKGKFGLQFKTKISIAHPNSNPSIDIKIYRDTAVVA